MSEITMKEYQQKAHTTAVYPNLTQLFVMSLKSEGQDRVFYAGQEREALSTLQMKERIEEALEKMESNISNPYYPALGLAGEVGELCNKLKKVMRDKGGEISPEFLADATKEMGDILWYVAELSSSLGIDLNEVAKLNLEKLAKRKENGTIQGSGDNR